MNILVTGGAGFIGLHLVRRLLRQGCSVAILDNFSSQVHAGVQTLPSDLRGDVELFKGDVRDRDLVTKAVQGRDTIVHLAAETGTGQSMYEVSRYEGVNIGGTAALIDCLVNHRKMCIQKFVVASSRAVYGEGQYHCSAHGILYPEARAIENPVAGRFEPACPACGRPCIPQATPENAPARTTSFYGLTKFVQEEMVLMFARSVGFSATAVRYQNVYGPGQSLRNPYTGILAIFFGLAQLNSPIEIFEDGKESRDFVFVEDAVEATLGFINAEGHHQGAFNVGTGVPTTVAEVAKEIVQFAGSGSAISITGSFRHGDIRHNFADTSKTRAAIGFTPQCAFQEGLARFLAWAETQKCSAAPSYQSSLREMRDRGFLNG